MLCYSVHCDEFVSVNKLLFKMMELIDFMQNREHPGSLPTVHSFCVMSDASHHLIWVLLFIPVIHHTIPGQLSEVYMISSLLWEVGVFPHLGSWFSLCRLLLR